MNKNRKKYILDNTSRKQKRILIWWIMFNKKKFKEFEEFLDGGMSVTPAFHHARYSIRVTPR